MRDDDPINKPPTKLMDEEERGFQLMKVDDTNKYSELDYDVKIVRQEKQKKQEDDYYPKKKKKKDDSDEEYERRKNKKHKKKKVSDS